MPPSIRIGEPLHADASGLHTNAASLPIQLDKLSPRCIAYCFTCGNISDMVSPEPSADFASN